MHDCPSAHDHVHASSSGPQTCSRCGHVPLAALENPLVTSQEMLTSHEQGCCWCNVSDTARKW
jgi:hypothetical protein